MSIKDTFRKLGKTVILDAKSTRFLVYLIRGLVIAGAALFFINGFAFHKLPEDKLTEIFLQSVSEAGLSEGKIIETVVNENSCTFLFVNDKEEKACATYVKSLYSRNWMQEKFYHSKMGILETGKITYEVNDRLYVYDVTCDFNGLANVKFSETKKSVLSVKVFGISVVICAAAAGRMIATVRMKR